MSPEGGQGLWAEAANPFPRHLAAEPPEESVRDEEDILPALPERRHRQGDDAQAVVEVLPEAALGDGLSEVCVGGCENTYIHGNPLPTADPFDLPLLEETQELDLEGKGKLAHLIEEKGPALGVLHPPLPADVCPREGPLLVAEELRL